MRGRCHRRNWLALAVAVATLYKDVASDMEYWFPVPITTAVFYAFNFASLFTLLIAIVADYRMTPEGVGRQQFKPVAFGTGIWITFFAPGLVTSAFMQPLYPTEAGRGWVSMVEWACYSIAWMGLLVGLSRYRLYDADAAISRSVAYAGRSWRCSCCPAWCAASSIRSARSTSVATSAQSGASGAP